MNTQEEKEKEQDDQWKYVNLKVRVSDGADSTELNKYNVGKSKAVYRLLEAQEERMNPGTHLYRLEK